MGSGRVLHRVPRDILGNARPPRHQMHVQMRPGMPYREDVDVLGTLVGQRAGERRDSPAGGGRFLRCQTTVIADMSARHDQVMPAQNVSTRLLREVEGNDVFDVVPSARQFDAAVDLAAEQAPSSVHEYAGSA